MFFLFHRCILRMLIELAFDHKGDKGGLDRETPGFHGVVYG